MHYIAFSPMYLLVFLLMQMYFMWRTQYINNILCMLVEFVGLNIGVMYHHYVITDVPVWMFMVYQCIKSKYRWKIEVQDA
jgi:hypothetical protein